MQQLWVSPPCTSILWEKAVPIACSSSVGCLFVFTTFLYFMLCMHVNTAWLACVLENPWTYFLHASQYILIHNTNICNRLLLVLFRLAFLYKLVSFVFFIIVSLLLGLINIKCWSLCLQCLLCKILLPNSGLMTQNKASVHMHVVICQLCQLSCMYTHKTNVQFAHHTHTHTHTHTHNARQNHHSETIEERVRFSKKSSGYATNMQWLQDLPPHSSRKSLPVQVPGSMVVLCWDQADAQWCPVQLQQSNAKHLQTKNLCYSICKKLLSEFQ